MGAKSLEEPRPAQAAQAGAEPREGASSSEEDGAPHVATAVAAAAAADAARKDEVQAAASASASGSGGDGPAAGAKEAKHSIKDYFKWRPLPWWVCFLGGIFFLTKLQLVYNDSPCAVLGTQGPVDAPAIKRAFRMLSMCTHPDRLRGRLKREPTQAESRRGEIIFNRASAAKDEIMKTLAKRRNQKKIPCYEGELEMAVVDFFAQVGKILTNVGVGDVVSLVRDFVWGICTFEHGFLNTVLSLLWFFFMSKIVKQFFVYMWRMGLIRGLLAVVTTTVIGPLPTVLNFLSLPVLRLVAFAKGVFDSGFRTDADISAAAQVPANAGVEPSTEASHADVAPPAAPSTARMAAASERVDRNTLRQRKKKPTEEEKERRQKELLSGVPEARPVEDVNAQPQSGVMPEGIWQCIRWTSPSPVKARQAAAAAVQFDLLLILTKPIIPLVMLIAVGQVWNGLLSSIVIGHALRKWVPQMSYEAHHLLCSFFGVVHTLLGVSASQVEDYASREGKNVLHLAWSWSFKDVLSVMHMSLLGSTVTACSGLGNEPSYASSFAAGIALRIALAQDTVRGLGAIKMAGRWLEALLRDLGVALDAAEEVVAYSGGGIGDCGGGPFRMLVGESAARWTAVALKAWLMLLPLLATAHWLQRTLSAGRMLGKRWKTTRFVQRAVLSGLGLLQCIMIGNAELNAANGALANFWVAMLFGCVAESLLSTYDIRGLVRQLVFLVLFLLI